MLNTSAIPNIIEKTGTIFSFKYVKKSTGETITGSECVCTSSHFRPRTYNIKFLQSGEIRKVRHCLIIELNDQEVYE